MTDAVKLTQFVSDIRNIYAADKEYAEAGIEAYLTDTLSDIPSDGKIAVIDELARKFEARSIGLADGAVLTQRIMEGMFTFLLGKHVPRAELTPEELLERLADSLNTIFNMLNQLVDSINRAFCGEHTSEETIRQVIGYHLGNGNSADSLEGYLSKINKAFLTAQQAFKLAADSTMNQVVDELDPDRISDAVKGGLKFGPLHKAELYREYRKKYEVFKNWVNSGRYMEQVLSEFEKNCQNLFSDDVNDK